MTIDSVLGAKLAKRMSIATADKSGLGVLNEIRAALQTRYPRQSLMKYKNVIDARRDSTRRHIWLCADDYGISPAVNVAIRDLVVRGRINATSVMVIAPNFNRSEAVSLNILNASETRVAIGLHVTLTAPYWELSRSFQPVCD